MDLPDAVWNLERGYCLWVGAGVTRQAAAGYADVPLWAQVTRELEELAGVPSAGHQDFPSRLERCKVALGSTPFRNFVRRRYYTEYCVALLSQAAECLDREQLIPTHLLPIAALGQLANPIVSFNVEALSSLLIARPAGPVRVVFQLPHDMHRYTWREPGGTFQRLVFHPHGIATVAVVMTSGEYADNQETLAFRLAIHAAFGNALVIVGMSLDDKYLREQISQFRSSLGEIYWFDSQFSEATAKWAAQHRITAVRADWEDFWHVWGDLPIEIAQEDLAMAWYLAISLAAEEAEGGSLGSLERALRAQLPETERSDLAQLATSMARAGRETGEPGETILVHGRRPRAIELALRERLLRAGIQLPVIQTDYGAPQT